MCYKMGDVQANLVILMDQIVRLGDLYDMWQDGYSQKLSQRMHHALTGQVKKDWSRIIGDVEDWNNIDKDWNIMYNGKYNTVQRQNHVWNSFARTKVINETQNKELDNGRNGQSTRRKRSSKVAAD